MARTWFTTLSFSFRLTDHPKTTMECRYIRTDLNISAHDINYSAEENQIYLNAVKNIMTHR